jgi:hypothetical protein
MLQSIQTEVYPFPLVRYWQARFAGSIQTGHENDVSPRYIGDKYSQTIPHTVNN